MICIRWKRPKLSWRKHLVKVSRGYIYFSVHSFNRLPSLLVWWCVVSEVHVYESACDRWIWKKNMDLNSMKREDFDIDWHCHRVHCWIGGIVDSLCCEIKCFFGHAFGCYWLTEWWWLSFGVCCACIRCVIWNSILILHQMELEM